MLMVAAQVSDLIQLFRARGELTVSRSRYGWLVAQLASSEAYAVYETATTPTPVAIGSIAPLPDRAGEIWFGVRRGGLGRNSTSVVRITRGVLKQRYQDYPGGLYCHVLDGHSPGERLAALIGCVRDDCAYGDYRRWNWVF